MDEFVALIAVKGNSERIHKKNIRPFYNTNLLELKINQLKKVNNIDKIIVSSESKDCLDIAIKNNVSIHKRNPKFSTSDIPMSKVYSFLASEIEAENIVWVPVTNPLSDDRIYQEAIDIYKKFNSDYDCLISVSEIKEYVFYKKNPIGFKPNPWPKSQDLKDLSIMKFVVNIMSKNNMVNYGSLIGKKPYFYYLNSIDAWDIDFQEDFDFCEMIYKKKFI